jgi:hypothetical protein
MSCSRCSNVEFDGPTEDQQYVDCFGTDPLPTRYFCEHCQQWWKRIGERRWTQDDKSEGRFAEHDLTNELLGAHSYSGAQTRIEMIIEGRKVSILGTAKTIVPIDGTEEIELLHKDATPDCEVIDKETPQKFYNAVKNLVGQGTKFRTVLRNGWTTAAVLWSL